MKTLVVYDSLYGNTETIARTIAQALPGDVPVVRAGQANPAELATADLLIIGAPTHGSLPSETAQDLAASKMADPLVEKGWALAAEPEGFIVRGLKKGPLKRGEVERASAWAKQLAESLV
jgi:flavodoxin I